MPVLAYLGFIGLLLASAVLAVLDAQQRYAALTETAASLSRLESHTQLPTPEASFVSKSRPPGSPFLEGQSITLARAALLQRITGSITRAGGNLISSEIESQERQAADSYIGVSASFEIAQQSIQRLLYEIEAGMPYLYISQLSIHAASPNDESVRVLLSVSGMWRNQTGANAR